MQLQGQPRRLGALCLRFSTLTALALSAVLGCASNPSMSGSGRSPEPSTVPAPASPKVRTVDERLTRPNAHHLLARFSFGPTGPELEDAERSSAVQWLAWQLEPKAIDDAAAEMQVQLYSSALLPPDELRQEYGTVVDVVGANGSMTRRHEVDWRRFLRDAQAVEFLRKRTSNRQLFEVMADFWFNHFNVYAFKGRTRLLVTDYIENAIRPHALGRFEDLLKATAHHPAMLMYLDNHLSSVPRPPKRGKPRGGITENYARELLELHTLGVHGGYTPDDVVGVARILTGWTLADPRNDDCSFAFRPERHDAGAKTVLGVRFPEGGNQKEGDRLLELLANHPSTARHIAGRLCARFVADDPPQSCIERVADVFQLTRGDITAMIVSIVESEDFWRSENRLSKLKAPLHFMISAYRALDTPINARAAEVWGRELGQPLLLRPVPTGYPVEGEAWLSTADSLARMRFATALGLDTQRAVKDKENESREDDAAFIDRVQQAILTGPVSQETEDVIQSQLAQTRRSAQKRQLAVALALGSPEFQYF